MIGLRVYSMNAPMVGNFCNGRTAPSELTAESSATAAWNAPSCLAIPQDRPAPPSGSGMISSIDVFLNLQVSLSLQHPRRAVDPSGMAEQLPERSRSKLSTRHIHAIATPIASAPPEPPSPVMVTMIGTRICDISRRL